jgi:putative transposase
MPRTARLVVPGLPHHITQRGNRRQNVFFRDDDYELYIDLMAEWCARAGVDIWAYCLMTNHVHLIAVPDSEAALARAVSEAHRRYTQEINRRERWTGHLWQGRFASFVMDEPHTLLAARYVEMNPVAAHMTARPDDYRWSSVHAHLAGCDDRLAKAAPLREMVSVGWREFLMDEDDSFGSLLERHSSSGWPLGSDIFLESLEIRTGRAARPAPRGRPRLEERQD